MVYFSKRKVIYKSPLGGLGIRHWVFRAHTTNLPSLDMTGSQWFFSIQLRLGYLVLLNHFPESTQRRGKVCMGGIAQSDHQKLEMSVFKAFILNTYTYFILR
jgi:hypothetical protein